MRVQISPAKVAQRETTNRARTANTRKIAWDIAVVVICDSSTQDYPLAADREFFQHGEDCIMAHILLIDDDDLVAKTLRRSLEAAKHSVVVAHDGRAGLAALASQSFDLAVVDIIMPAMEGIETILCARKADKDLKVLAISGGGRTGTTDFLEIAKKFGAVGTLHKPFSPRDFVAEVERCLGQPAPSGNTE